MKYICNLVNTEDNKRKNDAKINKLEVNIADDIDTKIGPEPVFKNEKLVSTCGIFSLLFVVFCLAFINNTLSLIISNSSILSVSNFIFISLCILSLGIAFIMDNKLDEINDVRNNYNANKRRVLPINKLLEFLSNKDNYSNINYDPKTRIITYFNKDGLLRNLDVIDKINSNGEAYTEYWINDYIKIDIDNNKIIKYYPVNFKEV